MIFKSDKELEKYLLMKCKNVVAEAEKKVYDIVDNCLNQYYHEFTPKAYKRTEQLLYSLVRSGVKKVGNGYEAEVYFDESLLNYKKGYVELQDGSYGYATWDAENVLDVAMTGGEVGKVHGGYEYGTPIYGESFNKFHDIFGGLLKLLEDELIRQGIPIKK